MITTCPACQSRNIASMFNMGNQPMSLIALQADPAQSYCLERYPIRLEICRNCSHVFNGEFDPRQVNYSAAGCRMYNSGIRWQGHVEDVRQLLEKTCKVDMIVEVGAGDCSFLDSLDVVTPVGLAPLKVAVDPCEAVEAAEALGIQWHRELFHADAHIPDGAKDTLVIMRHLLEHMESPRDLLEQIAYRARRRTYRTWMYIEVPNCEVALKRCRIEDWTYEHPQHFTSKSMTALFHACGMDHFMILPKYSGEVLSCLVCLDPAEAKKDEIDVDATLASYKHTEGGINVEGQWMRDCLGQIAFWGGAGKSAMFIHRFGLPSHTTVVDSHDVKWNMCVPGTKIKMQSPAALLRNPVQYIIATTSWRAEDIRDEIKERGITCKGLLKFEDGKLVEVPLGN